MGMQCVLRHGFLHLLWAQNAMEGWAGFTQDIRQYYGVDMGCLNEEYRREQQEYFLETSAWADVHPSQLLGSPACFKRYDLLTVTLEEVAAPLKARGRSSQLPSPQSNMQTSGHAILPANSLT